MPLDAIERIAQTILYEGYVLWPYRRSSKKNQRRWTIGVILPRDFAAVSGTNDHGWARVQVLVTGAAPVVSARARFLQVVERKVARRTPSGGREFVDELDLNGERYLSWDEATEREVALGTLALGDLNPPRRITFHVPAGSTEEPLRTGDGTDAGAIVREWRELRGVVEVGAERVHDGAYRLTVDVTNQTAFAGLDREAALKQSFVSLHLALTGASGELVSPRDQPAELTDAAASCQSVRLFPVLVGNPGDRHAMIAAPIILDDYPRVSDESPGDLFDGTEIDQLLLLNVLTLTDDEKAEMRATDPRTRAILERTEALTADDFLRLHGTVRGVPSAPASGTEARDRDALDPFAPIERPSPGFVVVGGVSVSPGSRVRLRPRSGGDIFDLALAGRIAVVEAIEQDYDDRLSLAVTLPDDPGQDLGRERQIGHRFFFAPAEIEPLPDE